MNIETDTYKKLILDLAKERKIIYASIVGSKIYGWETNSSDIDIRGCFSYPAVEYLKIAQPKDNIDRTMECPTMVGKVNIDVTLFDLGKTLHLMMDNNCNILEDITAPTFFISGKEHRYLSDEIVPKIICKTVVNSYRGLATQNFKKYIAPHIYENKNFEIIPVKKYLYVMRALMAGIYVLNTGEIVPDIRELNKYFGIPEVDMLLDVKAGKEFMTTGEYENVKNNISVLFQEITEAEKNTKLPASNNYMRDEVNQFLVDVRLHS